MITTESSKSGINWFDISSVSFRSLSLHYSQSCSYKKRQEETKKNDDAALLETFHFFLLIFIILSWFSRTSSSKKKETETPIYYLFIIAFPVSSSSTPALLCLGMHPTLALALLSLSWRMTSLAIPAPVLAGWLAGWPPLRRPASVRWVTGVLWVTDLSPGRLQIDIVQPVCEQRKIQPRPRSQAQVSFETSRRWGCHEMSVESERHTYLVLVSEGLLWIVFFLFSGMIWFLFLK